MGSGAGGDRGELSKTVAAQECRGDRPPRSRRCSAARPAVSCSRSGCSGRRWSRASSSRSRPPGRSPRPGGASAELNDGLRRAPLFYGLYAGGSLSARRLCSSATRSCGSPSTSRCECAAAAARARHAHPSSPTGAPAPPRCGRAIASPSASPTIVVTLVGLLWRCFAFGYGVLHAAPQGRPPRSAARRGWGWRPLPERPPSFRWTGR